MMVEVVRVFPSNAGNPLTESPGWVNAIAVELVSPGSGYHDGTTLVASSVIRFASGGQITVRGEHSDVAADINRHLSPEPEPAAWISSHDPL